MSKAHKLVIYIYGVFCIFILTNHSFAQTLKITLQKDSIAASSGTTFTNYLTIKNIGLQQQNIAISFLAPQTIQFLSTIQEKISLHSNEVALIPLKGLINHDNIASVSKVTIQVHNTTENVLESVSFTVLFKENHQVSVSLSTPENTKTLFSDMESAYLPLRLVHNRSRQEKFHLSVSSTPEGVNQSLYPLSVVLSANQDTTISILINPLRHWSVSMPYQLAVLVTDTTGSIIGTVSYKLVVATTHKQFKSPQWLNNEGYSISAALTSFNGSEWAKETRIWGRDSVGKAMVDFQLHYLNYTINQYQQLQNSFISYRTSQAAIRLGSLYDYHEMPLFGRGIRVNINSPDHQWTFWAVNSQSNWLSRGENFLTGNIYSVRYDQTSSTLAGASWSLSSSYFTQPTTTRVGYLNFGSFRLNRSERHSFEVLGGSSIEYAQSGPDRAQTIGWAGRLNYSYKNQALGWHLNAYTSSPVYSGFQKGATLLNSQLLWQPSDKLTLLAALNHFQYNQVRFTSAVDSYRSEYGNTIAEISLSQRLGAFSFSLRPYWFAQNNHFFYTNQKAYSYRLSPAVFYTGHNKQRFELNYDFGLLNDRIQQSQPSYLSQRVMLSAAWGAFNLWGYWQKGPYFLNDLLNPNPAQTVFISATPMVNFNLLNNRLVGSIGFNYLYNAFYKEDKYIGVGQIHYKLTPDLQIRLDGNATPFNQQQELSFSRYRLEVTKRFNKLKVGHQGQLNLSFFEDTNANGIKDPKEQWMDSLLVTINENTLITNSKGNVTYRNIPSGTYTVSAVSAGRTGDPILFYEKLKVERTLTKLIPLSRTYPLRGQLHCQVDSYNQQPCQYNRFVIDIERNTQVVSSTIPLSNGTFSLHLPPGNYTLYLRDYSRQPQVVLKTVDFNLSETGQHPVFDWTVAGSTRSIDVVKFSKSLTLLNNTPKSNNSGQKSDSLAHPTEPASLHTNKSLMQLALPK